LFVFLHATHGLRRGLHSFAALRLVMTALMAAHASPLRTHYSRLHF
jgi:hypothetical protein